MSIIDVGLLVLLALSVIGGFRRGALLQIAGLIGLTAGVAIGVLLSSRAADAANGRLLRLSLAVGTVAICAAAGNFVGHLVGHHLRRKRPDAEPRGALDRADALGGVALSVAALLLATWFMGVNLAKGPFPSVARALRSSRIIEAMGTSLPQPPALILNLERVTNALGMPDAFADLPPIPAAPVPAPDAEEVNDAAAAGSASVVEILGDGCNPGELNQGTGFVVAEGYVVTNAHVVAGTEHQFVDDGTGDPAHRHPAEVVEFDTALDIAVLFVPDWDAPALELETDEVDRGTGGAVLGLAGEFPLKVVSAAVLSTIDGTGTDTFGNDEITRRLYELQAEIRPGDSGAPFVLPNGRVAGVVFAASRLDDGVGYAIVAAQVEPVVEDGVGDRSPVTSLGDCVI